MTGLLERTPAPTRRELGVGLLAAVSATGPARAAEPYADEPAAYSPRPVVLSPTARYLTPEGRARVVGYNDMRPMLERMDALFTAAHPGIGFELVLKGTRTGPAALTSGASAFAPMGAPFEAADLEAYRRAVGAEPLALKVAHDSLDPRALSSPTAIYVHRDNPLDRIDLPTAQRAFCAAAGRPAAQRWGELGLTGLWSDRPVHAFGLEPGLALSLFMQSAAFNGAPLRPDLRGFRKSLAAVAAMAADPLAVGFANVNHARPELKTLAVARTPGTPAISATAETIRAGLYPLDRHLLIYVRRETDGRVDPLVREYLRSVLSREGQRAVAADELRYIPLTRRDAETELCKLR